MQSHFYCLDTDFTKLYSKRQCMQWKFFSENIFLIRWLFCVGTENSFNVNKNAVYIQLPIRKGIKLKCILNIVTIYAKHRCSNRQTKQHVT
jgi:hypothetical protein